MKKRLINFDTYLGLSAEKYRRKGSFTIESVVIVPLVMIVFVAVIFAGIYVYNCESMTAVNEYIVIDTYSNKQQTTLVHSNKQHIMKQKLIGVRDISIAVDENENTVKSKASAKFNIPLALLRQILGEDVENIKSEVEAGNMNGRKKLVLYKCIFDGAKYLMGGE